jgi:hypothetical protein
MAGPEDSGTQGPIHVDQVLTIVLDQLAELAWQRLGLRTDALTGKVEQDLKQARRAIDAVDSLCKILATELDEEDRRQLANLCADLKANYLARGGGA